MTGQDIATRRARVLERSALIIARGRASGVNPPVETHVASMAWLPSSVRLPMRRKDIRFNGYRQAHRPSPDRRAGFLAA